MCMYSPPYTYIHVVLFHAISLAAYVDLDQDFAGFFSLNIGRHEGCLSYSFGIALAVFLNYSNSHWNCCHLLSQALPKALQISSKLEILFYQLDWTTLKLTHVLVHACVKCLNIQIRACANVQK